jgi:succinate dehydrogenase/fumarate reductase flavoprotein subunit
LVEYVVETDVLVVGGGMAGCFAAIKAKEKGVDVALVDKGYVGKSGQTPWASCTEVFNPEWGHKLDAWMDQVNTMGEYVNNREWTEIVLKGSYARYQDLVSWGVEFLKDKEGNPTIRGHAGLPGESREMEPHDGRIGKFSLVLRKKVVESGVKIIDRIMVTDLIKQDGKIVGAVGIPMESYDVYVFKSKAIVISTGAGGFKPWTGWPICELTGDGHAMAYRVGAEITGKEFQDTHTRPAETTLEKHPGQHGCWPRGRLINAEGEEVTLGLGTFAFIRDFEAHAGRAPLFRECLDVPGTKIQIVGSSAPGMSHHTSEGIWSINTKCASSVPGLYAAGDSLGANSIGATYSGSGKAIATASVTGTKAGLGAAEYALQVGKQTVDEGELAKLKKSVHIPLERKGGFSPKWVTQILQNIMTPYFISRIKEGKRIEAALTLVEFLRDHLVPKLTAKDAHELRLAHETKNMVLNAEMRLRASLFRTESRGGHYREDYPRRDDPTWLAWVLLKEDNGKMKAFKEPIPKEWWPDLSKPYEERYPVRFPGE